MATTDKKYLDLEGLQHLLEKLNSENRIIKHPTDRAKANGAYKFAVDANGHVTAGDLLKVGDIQDAAAASDIKNATITLSINGVKKTFTTNQASDDTLAWTLNDLGLTNALHFKGVVSSLPATTNYVEGDVILVGNKEYVLALNGTGNAKKWNELGDAESHALNSVKVEGDGTYITGGGDLKADRTLSHKLYNGAKNIGAYKVAIDSAGHVSSSSALTIANAGKHTHTAGASIPGDTYVGTVTPGSKKLSISKTAGTTATVVTDYAGSKSNLVTTTLYGVGATTVKASLADAGTELTYGNADVGTTVTGLAVRGSQITYGNANYKTSETTVMTGFNKVNNQAASAYQADYDSANECLVLTALTPATTGIHEATESTSKTYGCTADQKSVIPAKASTSKFKSYSFSEVDVPVKNSSTTTLATGSVSSTATGAEIMIGLGTKSTETVIKTESTYKAALGDTGDVDVITSVGSTKVSATPLTITVNDGGEHNHDFN